MDPVNRAIWNRFHIKYNDTLPYKAWQGDRIALAQFFGEMGFREGAEVGVENGRYSAHLCRNIKGLHLRCIDPWTAFGRHSDADMERTYQNARARLLRFGVQFIRKPSLEAARDIPDGSLDFVYIDGLHDFDSVIQDIIAWVPKVKRGGIVSGHDYVPIYQYGVIQAVDTYTRIHNIFLWYITHETLTPQAHSWFWVK